LSSRVIAAAALLLVCATTARAQPDTAIVRIRFAGSTAGFPPIVITLTRVDPPAQRWVRSARVTDTVTFAHLPPGPYRIQTHGAESADGSALLTAGPGEDIIVRVTVVPAAVDAASAVAVASRTPIEYMSTFGRAALQTFASSVNLWTIVDTAEPLTFADALDSGGVLAAERALVGAHGNSWTQTTFRIGGLDVTDVTSGGRPLWYPDLGMLEAVTVTSASAPVEVAAPGPSLTLFPREAGGRWRGDADGGVTPSSFRSTNARQPSPIAALASWRMLTVTAGGPIAEGRAGVMVSGTALRSAHTERGDEVELPGDVTSIAGTATAAPSDAQRLSLMTSAQRTRQVYGARARLADRSALERDRYVVAQAQWHRHAGAAWWIDAGVQSLRAASVAADAPNGTVERLRDGPVPALAIDDMGTRTRTTMSAGVAPDVSGFDRGRHAVRAGASVTRTGGDLTSPGSGPIGERVNGIPARAWVYSPARAAIHPAETAAAAFVADRVAVSDRFTIDAGVRAEIVRAGGADGTSVRWQTLAPRVSARWATAAARWSVFGSYSRYDHQLPLTALAYGDPAAAQANVFRWTDANGDGRAQASEFGALLARAGPGASGGLSSIDPSLERPRTDEFLLGVEWRAASAWNIRFAGIARRERHLVAVVNTGVPLSGYSVRRIFDPGLDLLGPEDDQILPVYDRLPATFGQDRYELTNPSGLDAAYDGLDLTVAGTIAARVHVLAGGTASRSYGSAANRGFLPVENDQGLIGELLTDPNATTYADGHVFFERGYSGKLAAWVESAKGLRAAAVARYQDGQNFARLVVVPDLQQGPEAIRAYANGRSRFTYAFTLDARVVQELRIGRVRVSAGVEAYNLLDTANEVEEDAVTGPAFYSSAYPEPDGYRSAPVRPQEAFFDTRLGEFLLPYETVRRAADPDAAVQEFLQSTYEAGANLGGWDRSTLEPAVRPARPPRRPWSTPPR